MTIITTATAGGRGCGSGTSHYSHERPGEVAAGREVSTCPHARSRQQTSDGFSAELLERNAFHSFSRRALTLTRVSRSLRIGQLVHMDSPSGHSALQCAQK
eukprot:scaffold31631_cov60-Phaeocystis_antarctica.AAC.3